jgi:hypothetical protein
MQRLVFGAIGGTGIVAVLFVMGIILYATGVSNALGMVALVAAVFLAILFGVLGVVGILSRYR